VVVKESVTRHVDGMPDLPQLQDYSRGVYVGVVGALLIEQNLVDLHLITNPAIQYYSCQTAQFFGNQTAAGDLIQGFQWSTNTKAAELSVTVEDAEGLAI
jgi:hypothetical protein